MASALLSHQPPRVLLLGGHGKVALHLTPLLLARSWDVISVIRNEEHRDELLKLGEGRPGKVEVLIESLEEIKSDEQAKKVVDKVRPSMVVWSAGAGGKGGPDRTFAIDRDACKHYIRASVSTPSIKKFLLVSYLGSRRNPPPWWNADEWAASVDVNETVLKNYYKAKLESDEELTAQAHLRRQAEKTETGGASFQDIILRPGSLTMDPATGKVELGKTTKSRGTVTREDVALVAAELLQRDDSRGWIDLLNGDVDIREAVARVCEEGVDCIEGEDTAKIYALATKS